MARTVRRSAARATTQEWLRKARKLARVLAVREYRRALFSHRVAATVEHEEQPFTDSYGTVIDIGSNRGQFAVFARRRWPDARLLCFEPLPAAREVLLSLAGELGNVEVMPYALAETPGRRALRIAEADDSSSLLAATPRQLAAFPKSTEVDEILVDVRRIDDLIDPADLSRPVLVKIDVQGAELNVLRGAPRLLESLQDMLIECSLVELYAGQALVDETVAFAQESGFHVNGVSQPARGPEGAPLQCDVLFSRGRTG